ncbi:hypothetical protein [Pseudonocardia lacus]|uniref:hypothetical protein n=1 Tax=Pseudonocardia lacus TaxID=2835865 RepID=UPI001BDD2D34|nr:hypothetical protein [Pseudonocardia lacus]
MQVGAPDTSLTGQAGVAVLGGLIDRLGAVGALDAGFGPIKTRDRGASGGRFLLALARAQICGHDHLVGLDRCRADRTRTWSVPHMGTIDYRDPNLSEEKRFDALRGQHPDLDIVRAPIEFDSLPPRRTYRCHPAGTALYVVARVPPSHHSRRAQGVVRTEGEEGKSGPSHVRHGGYQTHSG